MPSSTRPRVSIGLPVYNGERYLAEAIESILAQSFSNFELIICDNRSTDKTPEICQKYASHDLRIRYFRNDHNLGASPNYNRTFSLSNGDYFKWIAHDDVLTKDYLKKCLAALEANPHAVLCQSLIQYIDTNGENLGIYDSRLHGTEAVQASIRFAAITLLPHPCNEVFGLIRKNGLVKKDPMGTFHGGDRALLAELALCGQFIQLREPLSKMRLHPARYTESQTRPRDRMAWHDTQSRGKMHFPTWRLYREYLTIVWTKTKSPGERLYCYGHLLRWWTCNWNWARMVVDVVAVFVPNATTYAERVKQRVFRPRPGAPDKKRDRTIFH